MGHFLTLVLILGFSTQAFANPREEYFMVSNGQGVSSPSFSDGLSGENPAGLAYNQKLKLQANLAGFGGLTQNLRPSGAFLLGNGLLGAGLEYSRFNSAPLASGTSQINWGIAGRFQSISTTIGVSGHHETVGSGTYDIGMLVEPVHHLRIGAMIPNFTNGLNRVAGGLAYAFAQMVEVVVDAAYQPSTGYGTIKPGITIRTETVQLTGAYGIHLLGTGDTFLFPKFTGGLGIAVMQNAFLTYEYRGIPEHRLGLTLRFN